MRRAGGPGRGAPGRTTAAGAAALAVLTLLGAAKPATTSLAHTDAGRGEPAIVLIHGLGADGTAWDAVTRLLAEHHRVLAVDLPGHGRSAAQDSVRVEWVAEAVDRTLEAARVKRAIVVGHSYGGLVALELASTRPKRVLGVGVVDIMAHNPADPEQLAAIDQILTERYRIFVGSVFEPMVRDSTGQAWLLERAHQVPQAVLTAYFRDAWRADLRPAMAKLKAPLLVVASSALWPAGEPWDSAQVRLGYGRVRRAEGVRITQTGHFIPLDQPDTLAAAIEAFAGSLR